MTRRSVLPGVPPGPAALAVMVMIATALMVVVVLGWPWWGVPAVFFTGQAAYYGITARVMRPPTLAPPVIDPAEQARLDKLETIRISVEAGMPFLDYDDGRIWSVEESAEWLREQDRRREIEQEVIRCHVRVDELRRESFGVSRDAWLTVERVIEKERERIAELQAELDRLDGRVPAPGRDPRTNGPAVPAGSAHILGRERDGVHPVILGDGRVVDLTAGDLDWIEWASERLGSDATYITPTGVELTGRDVQSLARDLRRVDRRPVRSQVTPPPVPHPARKSPRRHPVTSAPGTGPIVGWDGRTPLRRAEVVPAPRDPEVIEQEMLLVKWRYDNGMISREQAISLALDFREELDAGSQDRP